MMRFIAGFAAGLAAGFLYVGHLFDRRTPTGREPIITLKTFERIVSISTWLVIVGAASACLYAVSFVWGIL